MSADIIQLIPRPKHGREPTDFPTIAFRSVVPDDPATGIGIKAAGVKANMAKDNSAEGLVPKPRLVRGAPVVDHLDTAPSEYVPSDWSEK